MDPKSVTNYLKVFIMFNNESLLIFNLDKNYEIFISPISAEEYFYFIN
jgi:hypothetical protein